MPRIIVGKWGKDLAIRLPGKIAKAAGLREGEHVDIETRGREIVISRTIPPLSIEEMFRGKSPAEWRRAYAGAYDWDADETGVDQ